ncbi:MAG: FtsX-like permease family protein, partial [Candidatus Thorarchaeota archaeon]
RFYLEKPREGTTSYRFAILGTYSNVTQFASSSYNINGDLLVKVTSGYDISQVKVSIEDELQRGIDCVIDKKETFEGSLRNIMLYGSVNASFISSLIITTTAIILMILIQSLENEREVVTLKILGISPKQLFSMFLTEASSVVAFGSIIGAGLGIFAAVMFTDMLTFETQIPVTEIMVPGLELTLAYLLLFGSSIIAAALTSWLIFRKDTIKAIKQI